jgi:hypothetical protein
VASPDIPGYPESKNKQFEAAVLALAAYLCDQEIACDRCRNRAIRVLNPGGRRVQ